MASVKNFPPRPKGADGAENKEEKMQKHYTVGDFMKKAKQDGFRTVAIFLGLVVYAAMLFWSGVHNYNLLTAGVPANLRALGFLGFVVLEINAIALPLALHFWTHASLHRWAAIIFYALDLGLLFLNTILDYSLVTQSGLTTRATWLQAYRDFVLPGTPILAGVTWPVLWLLSPAHKHRQMLAELETSTQEVLAQRVADAAQSIEVEELVREAAHELALRVVRNTLSLPVRALPAPAEAHVKPSPNGHKPEAAGENPTRPPAEAARPPRM